MVDTAASKPLGFIAREGSTLSPRITNPKIKKNAIFKAF
jgi:hypothetical protein